MSSCGTLRRTEPTLVRCVPGAIEQILDNLLDNALAVSPSGASIEVEIDADRTRRPSSCASSTTARDYRDAAKVEAMRRFWRGDITRPGTGLGLAIVDTLGSGVGRPGRA